MRRFFSRRKVTGSASREVAPDEIFLDSSNLPNFDVYQFEGRLERPISLRAITLVGIFFALIFVLLAYQAWGLQVKKGEAYRILSERNSLRSTVIFAPRGLIQDRNEVQLVSNVANQDHPEYPSREYIKKDGFGHLLGYVEYPKQDASGVYFRYDFTGKDGVEQFYNDLLAGKNGVKIAEHNALGGVESESLIQFPQYGATLTLSIDARVQEAFYGFIKGLASSNGFASGAGIIMDSRTGEILAMTSFPEFSSSIMSEGSDRAAIQKYISDTRQPFLDRAVSGLYTPGSIVKPFLALGALKEGVITPEKEILSTGSISIPNPYDSTKKSVFNDWRAHGWVDMRRALAVSSDVYFYEIGGGFENQIGLGIARIKKYMQLFGFGASDPKNALLAVEGTLPDPAWKAKTFDGEVWRIGDTYNTSIGQYGMQVTPMQAVRATAALANGGILLEPTLLLNGNRGRNSARALDFSADDMKVIQEGMRDAVLLGTAGNLNIPAVAIAAKTGTAELGSKKQLVNSWVEGFFPYENPRYAFVVIMERGPYENTVGALYVMRQLFEWMSQHTPEYLQ
ncbi:MAG: hypothetical protein A2664_02760 [Candidatus Taylorbacteria bacterium RIFCSPHIGHO2_01_FULL_46_22b]|uniref:Penicillin-binding protein transpeptidase domain-containing protein n=1 Tax=Candidatus Taylorbacteria bacterium RIFCSPHIGHO2_01_FULL_46_22b TaxID=1802301 RepID=A0A1G2M449_9BACT|nr:MAG: hypothetical protein A2664_02760 [Candidatus Taylorbacteria bacterium RIFCSPHIGHO2_01_FULL_46_22b]